MGLLILMLYDFIIVGQGISGTILYDFLRQISNKILVISYKKNVSSTEVATGIYNPISLKRCVLSWDIEKIMPYSLSYYNKVQKKLNKKIIFELPILKIFFNEEDKKSWEIKKHNNKVGKYITKITDRINHNFIKNNLGGAYINPSGFVDINLLTSVYNKKLTNDNIIWNEKFDHTLLSVNKNNVTYKNIKSKKMIFCEGSEGVNNPFFKYCKFNLCKGEVITLKPEKKIKINNILNKEVFITPYNNLIKVGSTYNRDDLTTNITKEANDYLISKIKNILSFKFTVLKQEAAIRPTVIDRRPIIGRHYKYDNLAIFNGFGSKSVLLAPYFANLFVKNLITNTSILTEVDVSRFSKKLTF